MKLPIQAQPINRKVGSLKIAAGTNGLRSIRASQIIDPHVPCDDCLAACALIALSGNATRAALCYRDCYFYNC